MTLPLQYRLVSSGDLSFLFICMFVCHSFELVYTSSEWIVSHLDFSMGTGCILKLHSAALQYSACFI